MSERKTDQAEQDLLRKNLETESFIIRFEAQVKDSYDTYAEWLSDVVMYCMCNGLAGGYEFNIYKDDDLKKFYEAGDSVEDAALKVFARC